MAIFLDFTGLGIIVPVVPTIFSGNDHTLFDPSVTANIREYYYGLLMGIYGLCTVLGAPLLGALSDRLGRRKVLLLASVVNVIGYTIVGIGIANASLVMIFGGRILAGLFGSTLFIIQSAIADVSTERNKAKNFGIVGIAFGVGFIVGVGIGAATTQPEWVSWFDKPVPLFVAAFLAAMNMVYISFFMPETLPAKNKDKINIFTGIDNIAKAFSDRKLRNVYLFIFLLAMGFTLFIQFLPLYLSSNFGYQEVGIALMFFYVGACAAITQGIFLRIAATRYLPVQVLMVSIPMFAVVYLALMLPESAFFLYFLMTFLMFSHGLTFPNTLTILSNSVDRRHQGQAIGINQSMISLASALSALFAAFVAGQFDDTFIMVFGGGFTTLAFLVFLRYYFKRNAIIKHELSHAKLEKAEPGDFEKIRELLFSAGLPVADVETGQQEFYVIRCADRVLACAGLENYAESGLLRSVAVGVSYRKNGFGKRLVTAIRNAAKARGLDRMYLLTETAAQFFENLGFKHVDRSNVPQPLRESREFAEFCSESADVMQLSLPEPEAQS